MEMSKGDFAEHIGVSAGRVSQYIKAGLIDEAAIVGEGRRARINVEVATRQLSVRRHVGQAMGNGLQTRLDTEPAAGGDAPAAGGGLDEVISKDDVAKQIQREKLQQEQRRNRREAIDEAAQTGHLVSGEDFRREVGKTTQTLVNTFMGMAPDIANAIAAKFEIPQRDVLFEVRRVMNDKRAQAATALRLAADELPETVAASIEVEDA